MWIAGNVSYPMDRLSTRSQGHRVFRPCDQPIFTFGHCCRAWESANISKTNNHIVEFGQKINIDRNDLETS